MLIRLLCWSDTWGACSLRWALVRMKEGKDRGIGR